MAAAALPFLAAPVSAETKLIIDRYGDETRLYLRVPAEDLASLFKLPADHLPSDDTGVLDTEALRLGEWENAARTFEALEIFADGAERPAEDVTVLAHLRAMALPFADPFDAHIATSVCSETTPAVPPALTDLVAYVSARIDIAAPNATLRLRFPETGREAQTLQVLDYRAGQAIRTGMALVPDGATITLSVPPSPNTPDPRWILLAALLALAGGGSLLLTGAAALGRQLAGLIPNPSRS